MMDLDLHGALRAMNPNFVLSHLQASQPRRIAILLVVLYVYLCYADSQCFPSPTCLLFIRQALTDINSVVVQQELRSASSASEAAHNTLINANYEAFLRALELDQISFRACDARARTAEETNNHKAAELLEAVHHQSWEAAAAFAENRFPVFYGKADSLASDLPSQVASWAARTTMSAHGVAKILWVNLSVLGVVSAKQLAWAADYVAAELHALPCTSVAIVIQSNRIYAEPRGACKVEEADGASHAEMDAKSERSSDSEGQAGLWNGKTQGEGSLRMGQANMLRAERNKIEELFSESRRGLIVDNVQMVFDPSTVWGNRHGCHNMLIITPQSVLPNNPAGVVFSNYAAMRPSNPLTKQTNSL
jgi:hypothetical protein